MVTVTQIGRFFGVSATTVCNALNGRGGLAAEKARSIRAYADKVGYRPAYMAKSLLKGRTDMIGLCLRAGPEDPWFAGLLHRVQNRFRDRGFHLNPGFAEGGLEQERQVLNLFREFRVDAVLVGPLGLLAQYRALADLLVHHHYVLAFDAVESLPVDHVKIDAYRGAQLAVDHLAAHGHRRIGFLAAHPLERNHPAFRTRLAGYYNALRRHGLPLRPKWIIALDTDPDPIDHPLSAFLAGKPELPSAFFCHNDLQAARAIKVFDQFGIRVPRDVSLVGFDNQPIADITLPGLTSVGFDLDHYAEQIVVRVLRAVGKKGGLKRSLASPPAWQFEEPPKLIERQSVRRIV